MKLMIEIDNEAYKGLVTEEHILVKRILDAVKNGTPIPDNATNGDVMKAIFKPNRITRVDDNTVNIDYDITPEWWNAPYQKGGSDDD